MNELSPGLVLILGAAQAFSAGDFPSERVEDVVSISTVIVIAGGTGVVFVRVVMDLMANVAVRGAGQVGCDGVHRHVDRSVAHRVHRRAVARAMREGHHARELGQRRQ